MKFLPYQITVHKDNSRLRIINKARQIGLSFFISWEAVNRAIYLKRNVLLASASLRQSQELNHKARKWLEVYQKFAPLKLDRDSMQELGVAGRGRIYTLPSNPKTVRGFSGDVYLDEFALHKDQHLIYRALFPTITRGYNLTILSTPLGLNDLFAEIWHKPDKYKGYSRHEIDIYSAVKQGLDIDINFIKDNVDEETFLQEYMCQFLDEATSYFPYELLLGLTGEEFVSGETFLGVDFARRKDLTAIYVYSKVGDHYYYKRHEILQNQRFGVQENIIRQIIREENISRGAIDATGIGQQIAEEISLDFPFVEPVTFTNPLKETLVTNVKKIAEKRSLTIPNDRELINDFHSIKKTVTTAGNVRFDSERTDKGHSDRFWASALALYSGEESRGSLIDTAFII